MKKQKRSFTVDYSFNWTYGVEIKKMRDDLDELEKLGATHIEIDSYIEWDCDYVSIEAIAIRMETDKECLERETEYKNREDGIRQREIDHLNALKKKYEK